MMDCENPKKFKNQKAEAEGNARKKELTGTIKQFCYAATHSKPVCRHSAAATCLQQRWPTSQQHQCSLAQVLVKPCCHLLIILELL